MNTGMEWMRRAVVAVGVVLFSVAGPWVWWWSANAVDLWPLQWPPTEVPARAVLAGLWLVCAACWALIEVSLAAELVARVANVPRWLRRLPLVSGVTSVVAVALAHTGPMARAAPSTSAVVAADTGVVVPEKVSETVSSGKVGSGKVAQEPGSTSVVHVVAPGDDLWTLAERYYGDGLGWRRIYQANVDTVRDPNVIRVGWRLQIPGVSHETQVALGVASVGVGESRLETGPIETGSPETAPTEAAPTGTPTQSTGSVAPSPTPATPTAEPSHLGEVSATPGPGTGASASADQPASEPVDRGDSAATPTLTASDMAGVAGIAGGVAATLVAGLTLHRRRQLMRVEAGHRPMADPQLDRLERALRRAAQPRTHEVVEIVQTVISRHCRGGVLPPLEFLRLDGDRVDLQWGQSPAFVGGDVDPGPPPAGWEAVEGRWTVDVDLLPPDVEPAPRAFPGLAAWARTPSGGEFVELSDRRSVGVVGPERADVVRALAASLFTGDGAHAQVYCVGLPEWEALGDPNVETTSTLADALARAGSPRSSARADRLEADFAGECAPVIVLCALDPTDADVDLLVAAAARGVTVVCAGYLQGDWILDAADSTWTWQGEVGCGGGSHSGASREVSGPGAGGSPSEGESPAARGEWLLDPVDSTLTWRARGSDPVEDLDAAVPTSVESDPLDEKLPFPGCTTGSAEMGASDEVRGRAELEKIPGQGATSHGVRLPAQGVAAAPEVGRSTLGQRSKCSYDEVRRAINGTALSMADDPRGKAAMHPATSSPGEFAQEPPADACDDVATTSAALLPCVLNAATGAHLAQLFSHTQSTETVPAPWWDTPNSPPLDSETDVNNPLRPHLTLLGPLELQATRGTPPTRAKRQCLEYAAWLLEHPGTTASAMASGLCVAESTRRSNMSRLRTWLGRDDDGVPYLPEAYSGRIALHPDVTSDWQRFCRLTGSSIARLDFDRARRALELVRGRPLQDAAPGMWFWAEVLRTDMTLRIRDVAAVAATVALRQGRLDDARWACARGMIVAPEDEILACLRIDVEVRAGDVVEAERLIDRLIHQAKVLEVDLSDAATACIEAATRTLGALARK